jgi:hypothetical protein
MAFALFITVKSCFYQRGNIMKFKNHNIILVLMFAVTALFVFGLGDTHAIPLQDLFDGATLQVGDKLFFGWHLIDADPQIPDFVEIEVIPLDDQLMNPGIRYEANGELAWARTAESDAPALRTIFGYDVMPVDSGLFIKDVSLVVTDWVVTDGGLGQNGISMIMGVVDSMGGGDILAAPRVCTDDLMSLGCTPSAFSEFEPIMSASIVTDIIVEARVGSEVSLDAFEQRFSQVAVPEPVTILLLGSGLAGLSVFRKKFRKK